MQKPIVPLPISGTAEKLRSPVSESIAEDIKVDLYAGKEVILYGFQNHGKTTVLRVLEKKLDEDEKLSFVHIVLDNPMYMDQLGDQLIDTIEKKLPSLGIPNELHPELGINEYLRRVDNELAEHKKDLTLVVDEGSWLGALVVDTEDPIVYCSPRTYGQFVEFTGTLTDLEHITSVLTLHRKLECKGYTSHVDTSQINLHEARPYSSDETAQVLSLYGDLVDFEPAAMERIVAVTQGHPLLISAMGRAIYIDFQQELCDGRSVTVTSDLVMGRLNNTWLDLLDLNSNRWENYDNAVQLPFPEGSAYLVAQE